MEEAYIYTTDTDCMFNLFTILWFGLLWTQVCVLVSLALIENQRWNRRKVATTLFYLNFSIGMAVSMWMVNSAG